VNQPINPPICGSDPAAFIVACGTLRAGVRRQLQRPQPLSDPLAVSGASDLSSRSAERLMTTV